MINPKRLTEKVIFGNIKSLLAIMLVALALPLTGCSQSSNQSEILVIDDKLSASLPVAIMALAIDETNLVIELVDEMGVSRATCTNLEIDQNNGTFKCNITLAAGTYTLGLDYSIIDPNYGTFLVAATTGININVIAGETTSADFSTAIISFEFDEDGDGVNNLAELNAGTDPSDDTCILDNSLIDNCALG